MIWCFWQDWTGCSLLQSICIQQPSQLCDGCVCTSRIYTKLENRSMTPLHLPGEPRPSPCLLLPLLYFYYRVAEAHHYGTFMCVCVGLQWNNNNTATGENDFPSKNGRIKINMTLTACHGFHQTVKKTDQKKFDGDFTTPSNITKRVI